MNININSETYKLVSKIKSNYPEKNFKEKTIADRRPTRLIKSRGP